jgi:iron complex outermembrane recepter protein
MDRENPGLALVRHGRPADGGRNPAGPALAVLPARPERTGALLLVTVAIATLALTQLAFAVQTPQDAPPEDPPADGDVDLTDLSLDELFDVSIEVTSVGKRTQDLADTAAAIHVLTSEDIRRSGLKTLPEVLRLVPGLHVARVNGGSWAISSHGFNGQYNGNMLVLIDGRSLYTTLFAGVFWDVQDIPLEDIERIEVVLGPGGPAWGSNSLNGVINVVSKRAADTQGTLVSTIVGTEMGPEVLVRHGNKTEDAHWRAWARMSGNDAMHPTETTGGHDDRDLLRGGFRIDWDSNPDETVTLDGGVYQGHTRQIIDIPSLTSPPFITKKDVQDVSGEHLLFNWTRNDGPSEETSLQAYWDGTNRSGLLAGEDRDTLDLEWRRRRQWGENHDVVFGFGARTTNSDTKTGKVGSYTPDDRVLNQQSMFAEDEIELVEDRLKLTLGARLENHTYTDVELSPSLRLTWTPTEDQTVWAAVTQAMRTPSQIEHDGTALFNVTPDAPFPGFDIQTVLHGNENVESGELLGFELGWRARVTPRLTLDVATFYNRYSNTVLFTMGAPTPVGPTTLEVPLVPVNDGTAHVRGFEVSSAFEAREDWRLSAGWAFLDVHTGSDGAISAFPDGAEASAPQNQIIITSTHDLTEEVELDLLLIHVDELSGLDVPAYWRADLRLGWRPDPGHEWSLGVQNLFHDQDLEWGGEPYGGESETETSVWLGYAWRF